MDKLNLFARLVKVDEGKRLVTGLLASEALDLDNEIFDYDTSKPNFLAWSEACTKASGGKTVGNLRAMHSKVAAGHITEIIFDDAAKTVEITANVTDDNEWGKVQKGTYGGFSLGGVYAKKWTDPDNKAAKRYTAKPSEASLADVPNNLDCTFTVHKVAGGDVLRKFAGGKLLDEESPVAGNGDKAPAGAESDSADATPPAVITLNKAAFNDFEAALNRIPEGPDREAAREYLAKTFKVNEAADAPVIDVVEPPAPVVEPSKLEALCQKILDRAKDDPTALKLMHQMFEYDGKPELAKGLCAVGGLCDLFERLGWAKDNATYEAAVEGDGSAVPGMFAKVMKSLGDVLIAMVQEEVSEALNKAMGGTVDEEELKRIDASEDLPELRRLCKTLLGAVANGSKATAKAAGILKLAKGVSVNEALEKVMKKVETQDATIAELSTGATVLNKTLKERDDEITTLKKTLKTPAGNATPPKLKVVDKGEDFVASGDGTGEKKIEKVMGSDGEPDDAATLIKQLHRHGGEPLEKKLGAAR